MLFVNTCLELFLKQERVQHDTTAASRQGKVIQVYIKSKCGHSNLLNPLLYGIGLILFNWLLLIPLLLDIRTNGSGSDDDKN
jgi:hypothetical protein